VAAHAVVKELRAASSKGEKRYWLHIALGRDFNTDESVDALGTQLEEVIE